MKKLDEIMELMADEMQDFREGLLQLQKLTGDLQNCSIPVSTEVMEKHLFSFFQKQKEKDLQAADKLKAINKKLEEAYILPKKLGMILGSFLILLITLIGFLSLELVKFQNPKQGSYSGLEYGQIKLYEQYFSQHPLVKEDFENWLQNQNIP